MRINLVSNTSFKAMAIVTGGDNESDAIKDAFDGKKQGLGTWDWKTGSQWIIATGDEDKGKLATLEAQIRDEFAIGGKTVEEVFEAGAREGKTAWFELWKEKIGKLNLPKFDPEEAYHFFKDALLKTAK